MASVFTSTYSAWNPDANSRLLFGIIFDCLVCLQFFVNLVFVGSQVASEAILKLKQMRYRLKQKKLRKARLDAEIEKFCRPPDANDSVENIKSELQLE